MKRKRFEKRISLVDLEDSLNEFVSFHNEFWNENAAKTEMKVYENEPRMRTKKLLELPVINSKNERDFTYVFLGPLPQIPKYNLRLTSEIANVLQLAKASYNEYVSYISERYSVLLKATNRFDIQTTFHTNISHFHSGLGRVIAFNLNYLDKHEIFFSADEREKKNQEMIFERMANEVSWFGEIVKKSGYYGTNFDKASQEIEKNWEKIHPTQDPY